MTKEQAAHVEEMRKLFPNSEVGRALEYQAAEIERLKALLDRDKTGLAAALSAVRGFARGWSWIPRGEWGSYSHEDQTTETLRLEVAHLLAHIEETARTALRESGQRADSAFRLTAPEGETP